MKRNGLSLLLFSILFLYLNNAAQATSILTGYVHHDGLFDQIGYEQDVEWLASEVMQEGALLTMNGLAYDSSHGEEIPSNATISLEATAESFNLDVGDSHIYFDDGEAGYFNEFYADVHLSTDIAGDNISSAYLNYQADNQIAMTCPGFGDVDCNPNDVGSIPYTTWGDVIFDLYFVPDAFFSGGLVTASGSWINDNITQATTEMLTFSVDFLISADGFTILNQNGNVSIDYSAFPDANGGYWIGAWYSPNSMINLDFNIGDISHHSVQTDFAATIWESHPVPEPTTMLLLGSGIIGIAGFRRKLKR